MVLPPLFEQRMKSQLGDEFLNFSISLQHDLPTSVRVNPSKMNSELNLERVPYSEFGYFLSQRPSFTLDPFFHCGLYYVQEASSMFLERAFRKAFPQGPVVALDLCAAPGGKSTHLASLMDGQGLLVSNEVIRQRAVILSENLKKWGYENVVVSNNDPRDFDRLPGFFDLIVVDAPCSGEGLFRKDANAMSEWSLENAQLCAERQRRIVADVWSSLKEGGVMIYSTCTYNPDENEGNLAWLNEFAEIESVEIELDPLWGVTKTYAGELAGYRFYPHKTKGEGFFLCAVRKLGKQDSSRYKKGKNNDLVSTKADRNLGLGYLVDKNLEVLTFSESLLAFPANYLDSLYELRNALRLVHAGVKIGEVKQRELVPAHELILSPICDQSKFPMAEISHEDALRFLKREEIRIESQERGWNLLTYQHVPIGLVKNLGNRLNSAFPKEWRIRMSIDSFQGETLEKERSKFPLSFV